MRFTGLDVVVLWSIAVIFVIGMMLPTISTDPEPWHLVGIILANVAVLVAILGTLAWVWRLAVKAWRRVRKQA